MSLITTCLLTTTTCLPTPPSHYLILFLFILLEQFKEQTALPPVYLSKTAVGKGSNDYYDPPLACYPSKTIRKRTAVAASSPPLLFLSDLGSRITSLAMILPSWSVQKKQQSEEKAVFLGQCNLSCFCMGSNIVTGSNTIL